MDSPLQFLPVFSVLPLCVRQQMCIRDRPKTLNRATGVVLVVLGAVVLLFKLVG